MGPHRSLYNVLTTLAYHYDVHRHVINSIAVLGAKRALPNAHLTQQITNQVVCVRAALLRSRGKINVSFAARYNGELN